jgi:hypothetical protein
VPGGHLHLEGEFLSEHRDEIELLIHNEGDRASVDNPLARIMKWDKDEKGRTTILTTTEHLAQRLGHALKKAYGEKSATAFRTKTSWPTYGGAAIEHKN